MNKRIRSKENRDERKPGSCIRKKQFLLLLAILTGLLLLCGCSSQNKNEEAEEGNCKLYYLNMDGTSLVSEKYTLQDSEADRESQTAELLTMLESEPKSADLRRTIAADLTPNGFEISDDTVTIDFPTAFLNLSRTDDVLIRAAVVKTVTQIPDNVYVSFTVDGKKITRDDGTVLGKFSSDDFLENEEAAINTRITRQVILYVTDDEGCSLIPVSRTVTFSSGTPLEKVVMQQLILGTTTPGFKSTIPSKTKLISISVVNGICYVNLDETFRNNQNKDISEQVVLYSIVNSLTELDNVDQVQISVNGETDGYVRYNDELNAFYRANMDLVKEANTVVSTEEE